jgi:WD40 repeat protein
MRDSDRREHVAQFKGHADFNNNNNWSLTWAPDGLHLLSAGDEGDPVIRSWDTSTWKQAGDPWFGHDDDINHIIFNPTSTHIASASDGNTVRLWQLDTGTEVMRYEHWDRVIRVAFSVDGCFIFSGGWDNKISQWEVLDDVLSAARQDPLSGELLAKVTISNYYSMHELTCAFFTGHIKRVYLQPALNGNTGSVPKFKRPS